MGRHKMDEEKLAQMQKEWAESGSTLYYFCKANWERLGYKNLNSLYATIYRRPIFKKGKSLIRRQGPRPVPRREKLFKKYQIPEATNGRR